MAPVGVRWAWAQFLFNAYNFLLEGGTVPEHFAESRTVFIPKTSDDERQTPWTEVVG